MDGTLEAWVEGLADDVAGRAVAAAGVIAAVDARLIAEPYPELIADKIAEAFDMRDAKAQPLPWKDPTQSPGWGTTAEFGPEQWAAAWPSLSSGRWGVRFAVDSNLAGSSPATVGELLAKAGASGWFLDIATAGSLPQSPWRFPLRVGALDEELASAVAQAVAGSGGWVPDLMRGVEVGGTTVVCDVLLLGGTIDETLDALTAAREVRCRVAVVTAPLDAWDAELVDGIRAGAGCEAVAFVPTTDPVGWAVGATEMLSHNAPLDVVVGQTPGALLVAPVATVGALRARRRAEALASALEQVAPEISRGEGGADPVVDALSADFDRIAAEGRFDNESGEASDMAHREAAAHEALERAQPPRWVQARLHAGAGADRVPVDAFRPATTHEIDVRIGHYELGWLAAGAPFPDDTLETEGPFDLTVVLTEPHLLSAPQRATIVLPVIGASTTATMTLTTKPDTTVVDARIIVLHGNRVIQTCRLQGDVREGGRVSLDASDVAEAEAMVRPSVAGLDDRRTFDLALIVNRSQDGASRVTAVGTDIVRQVSLDDVSEAVEAVRKRLGEIVDSEEDFTGLDAAGTRELLVFLATHGSLMYRALVGDFLGPELAEQQFLQIVSAKPDAFLPVEFAYEFRAPNPDAGLCPDALEALGVAEFPEGCPGDHDETVVCPFGFWAVSKVIERHAFQRASDVSEGFQVRSSPNRDRAEISLGPALAFAASDRVDAVTAGTIERVTRALIAASGDSAPLVDSWQTWQETVASEKKPGVLVLLSHTVKDDVTDTFGLEIGHGERVLAAQLDERFLPPSDRPVVVALLGCETAAAGQVGWERFPALFRRAGAEVIIGTLTEVLGRHAADVAEELVAALYECCGDTGMGLGEVMVGVRRRFLAKGLPMILALAVFGDADWLVAKRT